MQIRVYPDLMVFGGREGMPRQSGATRRFWNSAGAGEKVIVELRIAGWGAIPQLAPHAPAEEK